MSTHARARPVRLDFVADVHRAPLAGALLLVAGIAAVVGAGVSFNRVLQERNRLDAELASIPRPRHVTPSAESLKLAADAETMQRELMLPWTLLLSELEAASHDQAGTVSLLRIEPDPGKKLVRITAEVRSLPDALSYLKRLQKSSVLRYPMLESHERRKDDPERALVVKLAAEWRT